MKKRFSEEQIIGFLREAEAGLPVFAAPHALAILEPTSKEGDRP